MSLCTSTFLFLCVLFLKRLVMVFAALTAGIFAIKGKCNAATRLTNELVESLHQIPKTGTLTWLTNYPFRTVKMIKHHVFFTTTKSPSVTIAAQPGVMELVITLVGMWTWDEIRGDWQSHEYIYYTTNGHSIIWIHNRTNCIQHIWMPIHMNTHDCPKPRRT